jgi:hypothetical protein
MNCEKVVRVNEVLMRLKDELDLKDAHTIVSDGYVVMSATNPYFRHTLHTFLQAEENFKLVAVSNKIKYYSFDGTEFNEQDRLGFCRYMKNYKPEDWAIIKEQFASISKRVKETLILYRNKLREVPYLQYYDEEISDMADKIFSRATKEINEINQAAKSLAEKIPQKVILTDRASVEISEELCELRVGLASTLEGTYTLEESQPLEWLLNLKLTALMPTQVDEKHPLVDGVSRNLASIELSIPNNPSIITRIERIIQGAYPTYSFKLKEPINEQAIQSMINLLLS